MLKKILIGFGILLFILFIGLLIFVNTGASLPDNTETIVNEVLNNEPPVMVTGETGMADNNGINIWYESKLPADSVKGTVLLVMGLGASALIWDNEFCQLFVDEGYQVVRYDNRDVGMSSWVEDWSEDQPYTLADMADDGIAVLDALKIDKAHVVGASMGGMIVQQMAIDHQDRLASLSSIMSSGFMMDEDIPFPTNMNLNLARMSLKYLFFTNDEKQLKFHIANQESLKGNGGYDSDVLNSAQTTLYELKKRNGYNQAAVNHQVKAIEASGSRLDKLSQIKIPTVVIHGKSDPLVRFEHAQKYAPLIPNTDTLYIDGMGHDLPKVYRQEIKRSILTTIAKASLKESGALVTI